MTPERQQFRILRRLFLSRMIDLDILSRRGEPQKLLVQVASMLAALSLVLSLYAVPKYAITKLKPHQLLVAAWGDQEFFIATTMTVVGLFTVLCWDTIFPQKRDVLVLLPLPVRPRVMVAAKMAAVGSALGVSIIATNVFLGLSYPLLVIPPDAGSFGFLRSLAAFWITMVCAGAFLFSTLLAVQGVASQLLSYRLYSRVSSYLQFFAFFVILGLYFLTPPLATPQRLTAPGNQALLAWLPSYWFLGLFQELNGPVEPLFSGLARQALSNLGIAVAIAVTTYALALQRNTRKIVEQPDIAPSDRSRCAAAIAAWILKRLVRKPYEQAVVLFTARTISRSRQHRLLLAAYLGVAFAIALAYSKDLLYHRAADAWRHPNVPLLVIGAVFLFLPIAGVRALFAMPIDLKSNWIFQVTAVQSPAGYFRAARKALIVVAALPVWAAASVLYFSIWPVRDALMHMILLILTGLLVVDVSMNHFRKIPFTCSYLPGKSNLNVRLGAYAVLFTACTDFGVRLELIALQSIRGFTILLIFLFAAYVWAHRRMIASAVEPHERVQFEETAMSEVAPLVLHG